MWQCFTFLDDCFSQMGVPLCLAHLVSLIIDIIMKRQPIKIHLFYNRRNIPCWHVGRKWHLPILWGVNLFAFPPSKIHLAVQTVKMSRRIPDCFNRFSHEIWTMYILSKFRISATTIIYLIWKIRTLFFIGAPGFPLFDVLSRRENNTLILKI